MKVLVDPTLYAIQHIRKLRGGSQAQLLRASDGAYYVTKCLNNPQHVCVLANEMLATRLGHLLGLPLPRVHSIEVSEWLIEHTNELRIELAGSSIPWKAGSHLASLYVEDPSNGAVFDYLPQSLLERVDNICDFARVLVLDRWTRNSDGRQAVFSRQDGRRGYRATFIDQGYCFNAGDWDFSDSPLRGVFAMNCVYKTVTGWDAFEPAFTRAEQMDVDEIWRIAATIPPEWYQDIVNHSPTGIAWGYGGSGPAQCALAILLDYLGDEQRARALYQDFKFTVVAAFPPNSTWTLTGRDIESALSRISNRRQQS